MTVSPDTIQNSGNVTHHEHRDVGRRCGDRPEPGPLPRDMREASASATVIVTPTAASPLALAPAFTG